MTFEHNFADVFPHVSELHWRSLVETALKGAAFDKLVSHTADGIVLQPLYPAAPGAHDTKARLGRWHNLARIDHSDFESANAQALEDLRGGASGLHIVFQNSLGAHGFGLPTPKSADIATLFQGIHLEYGIAIELDLSAETQIAAQLIADYVHQQGIAPNLLNISFGLNPLMRADAPGTADLAQSVRNLAHYNLKGPFAVADGRAVHDAGGSEAQELAFVLASALASLRAFEASGMALSQARALLSFRMSADADQFVSLAKFRALRRLWAHVERSCGLAPEPIRIHATSAWRMMTRRDPWVNVLRAGTAAFAAGLGGADCISLLPFTQALGLPDPFARRLTRNIQLILLEESNLDKVADPAAGAGGIEALTEALCEKAWTLFQSIEAQGGLDAALDAGTVQADIAKVRAARDKNIARRKEPLTGLSEFPHIHEADVAVLAPMPVNAPHAAGGLAPHRLSEAFEALRDAAEAAPLRPKVFLANLGTVADFNARSMFAKNFYEAGGIEALGNDGFATLDEMVAAYRNSGASLACLCSSDAVYAQQAEAAAKALRLAGAQLAFAGRPAALEEPLKAAGVVQFIFAGCDLIETLRAAQTLGAAS